MIRNKFLNRLRKKYQRGGHPLDNTIPDRFKTHDELRRRRQYQEGGMYDIPRQYQTGGTAARGLIDWVGEKSATEALRTGLSKIGATRGISKFVGPIGVLSSLYGMHQSGQKHSGGRLGYIQNPNYVKGSDKFGGIGSTSQFIPGGGLVKTHQPSIWAKKQTGGMYDEPKLYQGGGMVLPVDFSRKVIGDATVEQLKKAHEASKDVRSNVSLDDLRSFTQFKKTLKPEKTIKEILSRDITDAMQARPKTFQSGGVTLPGGVMSSIPGSDAVEFTGASHEGGGIMLDSQTEVEGGETMDKVTMAKKGGKRDYFFSDHLKIKNKSFADMHKNILRNGGSQDEIDWLARMQEKAAGRNPNKVAKLGGVIEYKHGGVHKYQTGGEKPIKPKMKDFKSSTEYMKARMKYYKDLEAWENEQTDETQVNTDTIPANETIITDYVDDDSDEEEDLDEYFEEQKLNEEEEERQRKEELQTRANDLKQRAKKLGLDIEAFKGPGGGLLPSKLDAFESAVVEAETNFESNKAVAKDLGIEYNEDISPSDLQYKIDESQMVQGGGEGDVLPGEKGIPENQPKVEIGGKTYYLKDAKLQKYIEEQGEDFGDNWMDNLDAEVLENSGITSFEDFNDPDKVLAYQQSYNKKYPDSKIAEDGKFGEQTLRTGVLESNVLDEVVVHDTTDSDDDKTTEVITDDEDEFTLDRRDDINTDDIIGPDALKDAIFNKTITNDEIIDDEGGDDSTIVNRTIPEPHKAKIPWQAWAGMGAGLIPAAFSLWHKQPPAEQAVYTPGFTSPIVAERGKAPKLERYDYNQDIANVGSEVRGMHKYIETSGGGPANMINKMMAFSRGQDAKMKIRSAETRANIGVQNTEAQLEQQMTLDNMKRAQQASIFNAQMSRAETARMDQVNEANTARRQKRIDDMEYQKYAGMTSLAQSLQQGFGDILDYKADMAKAAAYGSGAGNVYRDALLLQQGWTFDPNTGQLVPPGKKTEIDTARFGGLRRLENYKR